MSLGVGHRVVIIVKIALAATVKIRLIGISYGLAIVILIKNTVYVSIECLHTRKSIDSTEARVVIGCWLDEYNTIRRHGALGGMNPEQFLQRWSEANTNQQHKSLTG